MINTDLSIEDIASKVIGCSIKVHRTLGTGLLKSAYKECLYFELIKAGLYVEKKNQCH